MSVPFRVSLVGLIAAVLSSGLVHAQEGTPPPTPEQTEAPPPVVPADSPPPEQLAPPSDAPVRSTQTVTDLQPAPALTTTPTAPPATVENSGAYLDGHPREGAFLAGPGSLTFIVHHTLLGASAGLVTQGLANNFQLDSDSREAMLIGTLVGAGLGFTASAWWQFTHWLNYPVASFGIINSLVGGMMMGGLLDLMSDDKIAIGWTAAIGAEIGAWLTATLGGGDMKLSDGLFVASGAAWGAIYGGLLMAILATSGTPISGNTWADTLMIAPGVAGGALALATLKYHPTSAQIIRADTFGVGAGAAVFFLSALFLGKLNVATPYVLSLLGSTGAIVAVSLLWEEAAEKPVALGAGARRESPYRAWWW